VSMRNHRPLHATALVAALVVAVLPLGLAACSRPEEGSQAERTDRTLAIAPHATSVDMKRDQGAHLHVRMEVAAGARLDTSERAQLASAARRFATSLAAWLYGDRDGVGVESIAPELRQGLENAPPYVPPDQIGSGNGLAVQVQVWVQTARSGVLAVTIRDSRTTYQVPASFERRAGRWQVVHLNND
jgi:hypothetical protein